MLSEVKDARQIENERYRRWFTDDFFDLVVWYDEEGDIFGFQLCYDKYQNERSLTWRRDEGFSHHRVDDGETTRGRGGHPMTPILIPDGVFNKRRIAQKFRSASKDIEPYLAEFVYKRMLGYPDLSAF